MKKILLTALLTLISISAFAVDQWHTKYDGFWKAGKKALITDDKINVRANPYRSAEALFQVNKGDIVTVKEITDSEFFADGAYTNWLLISCSKGTGYVVGRWSSGCYVEFDFNNNGKPEYFYYGAYRDIDEENKYPYFKDEFNVLNDNGEVVQFKDLTCISDIRPAFEEPRLTLVPDDAGFYFDNNPSIFIRTKYRYKGTTYCNVTLCGLLPWNDKTISRAHVIAASGCYSGKNGYSFTDYVFKEKTYSLFDNKWYENEDHTYLNASDFNEVRRWGNGPKDDPDEKSETISHLNK